VDDSNAILDLPAYALWVLSGLGLLSLGTLLGEPVMMSLGLAAFITAIAALSVTALPWQLLIWIGLTLAIVILLQGLMPRESEALRLPTEAHVHEAIPVGGCGHVWYSGALWKAQCQFSDVAIAIGQTVFVVGRQDNTLIVLPTMLTHPMSSLPSYDPSSTYSN
jgi:membrane protein implicated in regulation of membrane protease activity